MTYQRPKSSLHAWPWDAEIALRTERGRGGGDPRQKALFSHNHNHYFSCYQGYANTAPRLCAQRISARCSPFASPAHVWAAHFRLSVPPTTTDPLPQRTTRQITRQINVARPCAKPDARRVRRIICRASTIISSTIISSTTRCLHRVLHRRRPAAVHLILSRRWHSTRPLVPTATWYPRASHRSCYPRAPSLA